MSEETKKRITAITCFDQVYKIQGDVGKKQGLEMLRHTIAILEMQIAVCMQDKFKTMRVDLNISMEPEGFYVREGTIPDSYHDDLSSCAIKTPHFIPDFIPGSSPC